MTNIRLMDTKIRHLTADFYTDYSHCSEILSDPQRPYCVIILVVEGLKFAVPFRTNINHNSCFLFSGSPRGGNSGIDFSKSVVIIDNKYVGNVTFIDSYEYREFINKKAIILNRFKKFIEDYKIWVNNPEYYHQENLIMYSSLQYFHTELGI